MRSKPKVSIIIPAYNAENTIKKCLDSILSQTEREFEVIVIDDGSEDKTADICFGYTLKDARIHLIKQPNSGPGPARNRGIEVAKGEYLYFVDSDDSIHKDLIFDNYSLAAEKEKDILVFGYTKTEWQHGHKVEIKTQLKKRNLSGDEEIRLGLCEIFEEGASFAVWNKFFKRELILEHRIIFPDMRRNQDMLFTLKALKSMSSVTVNPNVYYHYNFEADAQKHDSDLIDHHMLVYREFYDLRPGWMEIDANKIYACKLFLLYFFHSVPYFIIRYEDKPVQKLRELVTHKMFEIYISKVGVQYATNFVTKLALIILKSRSPYLLFISVKLKEALSVLAGKNLLRRLFNTR